MGDLFHEDVPIEFIQQVLSTVESSPCHIFQTLTKRAGRLEKIAHRLKWPDNLWVGVTVELQKYANRIKKLSAVPASIRFVSFEPLLGPITNFDANCIDWAIVGGESGPHARPMAIDWVRNIRDRCVDYSIPFFFKQWGGIRKKVNGRLLDRKLWSQYPRMANMALELTAKGPNASVGSFLTIG
jgi:protein gp37